MNNEKIFCYFDSNRNFVEAHMNLNPDADKDVLDALSKNSKIKKLINSKIVDMSEICDSIKVADSLEKERLLESAKAFLDSYTITFDENSVYPIRVYNAMFKADRRFDGGDFAKKTHSAIYNSKFLNDANYKLANNENKSMKRM